MDQPDLSDPKAFDTALDRIFSNLEPGSTDPFLSNDDFVTALNNMFPLEELFSGLGLELVDPFVDSNNRNDKTNDNVFGMFSWDFCLTSDDGDESGVNEESTSAGIPGRESSTVQSSAQPETNEEMQPQLGIQELTVSKLFDSSSPSPPLSGTSGTMQPKTKKPKTKKKRQPRHKKQESTGSKLSNPASCGSPSSGMSGTVQSSEMGTETPLLGGRPIQQKAPSFDAPYDRNYVPLQRTLADAFIQTRRELFYYKMDVAEDAIKRYRADKAMEKIPHEKRIYKNALERVRYARRRLKEFDAKAQRQQMEESGQ